MANPIPHTLNEANGHILNVPGNGKPLPIQNFRDKSLILVVGGVGSYDVQVSNDKVNWVTIAAALVAAGSPNLVTNEEGAADRFPHKVAFMRIVTNTFNAGDAAEFLGEDAG